MAGELCAMTEAINAIGTRPRLLIIRHLDAAALRFSDLKRRTGLSSRTLSLNLRHLRALGLVELRDGSYGLSQAGTRLTPILRSIGRWGKEVRLVEA